MRSAAAASISGSTIRRPTRRSGSSRARSRGSTAGSRARSPSSWRPCGRSGWRRCRAWPRRSTGPRRSRHSTPTTSTRPSSARRSAACWRTSTISSASAPRSRRRASPRSWPVPAEPVPGDLSAAVARFAALLRRSGLPVTLVEVTDGVRALDHLDITDRQELYLGLRAVFVTRPEEVPPFDRCFEAFWRVLPEGDEQSGFIPAPSLDDPGADAMVKSGQKREALALDSGGEEEGEEAGDPLSVPLASEAEGLVNQDFSTFSADQLDELLKLTIKIARRLAHRMSRRRRPVKRRGRVDLRRTLRANLTRGDL